MKNKIKYIIIILTSAFFTTYAQSNETKNKNFVIDEKIETEVEERISNSEFGNIIEIFSVYENSIIAEFYENDSLIISTIGQNRKMVFRSFYYELDGVLKIDGMFGLFGGFGFSISFIDGEAIVSHLLASDEVPEYSMTKDDSLEYRIEVPCVNTKLILSKFPQLESEEVIYGMVEFESHNYYPSAQTENGIEIEDRKKTRTDMKIYFKSKYLDVGKY